MNSIQKEREAFECEFKQTDYYIAHGDLSTLMLCDDQYALDDVQVSFEMWQAAKAQAVPEGFGLFDGDTLTYSNGYSINCSFDDEFDCYVFDVSKDGCYIKTGMTQLEQAHCLVLSMIKLDAKDSMVEAQEPTND